MEGFAPHPGPWACKNRMRQQTSRNTSGRWPQLSGVPSSCGGRVEQWVQGLVQGRLTNTGVVFHLIMPVLFELHVRTWLERCSVWWSGEGSRKAAQTKSDKKTLKDSPACTSMCVWSFCTTHIVPVYTIVPVNHIPRWLHTYTQIQLLNWLVLSGQCQIAG